MKKYEEAWEQLKGLTPSKQLQQKMLQNISTRTSAKQSNTQKTKRKSATVVTILFIVVLSVLILSILQTPTTTLYTADTTKKITKIYAHNNEDKDTFIAKASCFYVPQQCYLNKQHLVLLQAKIEQSPIVTVSADQWQASGYFIPRDILLIYSDGTSQQWKAIQNDVLFNLQTQQAIQLDMPFDALANYNNYSLQSKLFIIANIFVLLSHLTLWLAKKRMPHIERRFFAATVEHAIANAIMLALFLGISLGIYLLKNNVHATSILGMFTIYSTMQIYYRKKAGEPRGYLIASSIVQLFIALSFTLLYVYFNVHF